MNLGKHLGTVGLLLAVAVYWLVYTRFPAIAQGMGWVDDGALGKRYSLVAAVSALLALTPLLVLQVVLERRTARRAPGVADPAPR